MEDYLRIGRASDITRPADRFLYRILELSPGLFAWGTLLLVVVLSFVIPAGIALFIIAFDIYWLLKTIYLSLHMRSTFSRMRANMKRDWLAELASHQPTSPSLPNTRWNDLYHLVILPFATEPVAIIRSSVESLTKTNYPLDRIILVLATEKRVPQSREIAESVLAEFGHLFFKALITAHPDGIAGEIRGKGSNETWAGRQVKELLIDPLGIPYERVIVSVFDIDTVVPPQFFGCLTWQYMAADRPLRSSFQPIPLFVNNIWEAPAFARIFAFSTSFWQMIQQSRPEKLITFSSQSISFRALVDVGFWLPNVVSEDSRIFWQCLLHYDGDWRTIPLFYPVYMDANVAPTFWQTLKNQYKQIRRWAYGVENNPYFLFGFIKNKRIPFRKKWHMSWFMIESTHSLATNSFLIFLLGWLPLFVGGNEFSGTVLSYNLPQITRFIMNLAMIGLVTSAILSILLLPPRPPQYGRFKYLWMLFQWLLFPINLIFFGAVPALDAQTRLMAGNYLGFWVTPKSRTLQ